MMKSFQDEKLTLRIQQQGLVYRLVEQFEEISRIDLAKLSQLAPATITSLTRELIDKKLLIEKAVRSTESRGRPAIGLSVSPFYWQSLSAILTEDQFTIFLCELDGTLITKQFYSLEQVSFDQLDIFLKSYMEDFLSKNEVKMPHPIAFSIVVVGKLDEQNNLSKLGKADVDLNLQTLFKSFFKIPILIKEYFETWLLWESSLGTVIGYENVLFLEIDDVINLSILSNGKLFNPQNNYKINVDLLQVPKFSPLQDQINLSLPDVERYQFKNQVSHQVIYELIDLAYPDNGLKNNLNKFHFLSQKIKAGDEPAIEILELVVNILAYIIMNLVKIFSSQRVMLISRLLENKNIFLNMINKTLIAYLNDPTSQVEVLTSRYEWNDPIVISASIKRGIYDGTLLKEVISN